MGYPSSWLKFALLAAVIWGLTACGSHYYHRVKKGETLYSISWQYGQDYRTLAKWNDMNEPYFLREGQILQLAPPRKQQWTLLSKTVPAQVDDIGNSGGAPARTAAQEAASPDKAAETRVATRAQRIEWQWPTAGKVAKRFSTGRSGNKGVDISGQFGQPVRAAAPGRVVYSGNGLKAYGNLVILKHNEFFLSAYAHNEKLLVSEGERVKVGQQIASMGRTNGDHVRLHFEIRRDGKPVDPLRYLP
jgi:lipoprotein NlpD